MAGLCKVTLIGNLGADPELRYAASGKPVTKFSVACSSRRRMPDGEFQDHTEWFRVSAFGRLAEVASEYLRKGSRVYLEGKLESRTFEGNDGKQRYSLDVMANDFQILDSRRGGEGDDSQARVDTVDASPRAPSGPGGGGDDFDDVPF